MAEVSVIVPVYNVESYLHRCIDSILSQTFSCFELILVDDGSPDKCGAICDAYAKKDRRVHVIHQENGGLSAARNAGIDWVLAHTDSQWITFVDSDDWIHPEMLERLLFAAEAHDVRISVCGYLETSGSVPGELPVSGFALREPEKFYVPYNTNAVISCAKLYHRDCFSEIRFPEGKLHEDEFTTYKILFAEKQIAVTPMPLYFYYYNPESITKSKWTPKRLDSVEAFQCQLRYFGEHGFPKAFEAAAVCYLYTISRQKRCVQESDLPEEEKRGYLENLNKLYWRALPQYGHFLFKRRNADVLCEVFPGIQPAFTALRKAYRVLRGKKEVV